MQFQKMIVAVLLAIAAFGAGGLQAQTGSSYTAYDDEDHYWSTFTSMREYSNPNTVMYLLFLRDNPGFDTLTGFRIFIWTHTLAATDIERFSLWADLDGDAKATAADTRLSDFDLSTFPAPGVNTYIKFSNINFTMPQSEIALMLTIELKPNVPIGRNIQIWLDSSVLEMSAGSNCPLGIYQGPTTTVRSSYGRVTLGSLLAVPAANTVPDALSQPVLQFSLVHDGDGFAPTTVTKLVVRGDYLAAISPHSATSADITAIRLYREANAPNGVVDQADVLVKTGVLIGTGAYTSFIYEFSALTEQLQPGQPVNYLVVIDVAPAAVVPHVFRMYINRSAADIVHNGFGFIGSTTKVLDDPQTIVAVSAGAYLQIIDGPNNNVAGTNLAAPLGMRIEARLSGGALYTTFTGPVTATVETGPDLNFTPISQTAVQASAGVATFQLTQMKTVGTYTLRFSAPPLTAAISATFVISHGAPYRVVIINQPQNGVAGVALPPPPVCQVRDFYDNLATTFNAAVTATLQNNTPGATLSNNVVLASSGVVTYPDLQVNRPGVGYVLVFSATGLAASPQSSAFAIVLGPPSQIFMLQQPTTTAGGSGIGPPLRARGQGGRGHPIVAYNGDMTVAIGANPSSGTLSGTQSIAVSNGIAIFADLSINFAGTGYTLVFSIDPNPNPVVNKTSASFSIVVGSPVKLALTSQPASTTGGMAFAPQPVVQVQDAGGNVIAGDSSTEITAKITVGTGEPGSQLLGGLMVVASSGVATFIDLAVTKAGPNPYTLTFSANTGYSDVISSAFFISVGPAAQVGFSIQPAGASFAQVFLQQPVAQVEDLGGNLVSGNPQRQISIALDPASGTLGASLTGNTSFMSVGGEVAFTNLAIDFAGVDFVLVVSASGLNDGQSILFNVASEATQLGLFVQPGIGQIGLLLSSQPVVETRDANGTLFTGDNFTLVTAEIAPGTGSPGANLTGTTSVYVTAGVATFTNLQIDTAGVGYRLKFTSYPSLTPVFSTAFDVAGIAVKLKVTRQPTGATPGEFLSTQPRVEIADNNGVRCIGENSITVNAYITPATGTEHAIMSGTNPIPVVNGIADFTDLNIDRPGIGYTLSFSSAPSMLPTSTNAFEIIGTVTPNHNSDNDIEGGVDGGTCAAGSSLPPSAPWLLLALGTLCALCALRTLLTTPRRRKT